MRRSAGFTGEAARELVVELVVPAATPYMRRVRRPGPGSRAAPVERRQIRPNSGRKSAE
jgi:hypothetical protein